MKNSRQKADTEIVRKQNRSLVLETLRKFGPLASIELGEKTKLSPATISAITNDMLDERLIEEDRAETQKHRQIQRGRPKVKLTLAANAALILGIQVAHNAFHMILSDFMGHIKARKLFHVDSAELPADQLETLLVETVATFLDAENITPADVTIASIACQGSVDAVRGEIIWGPAFSAKNIRIAKPLLEKLSIRSLVANDTNAIAHALHTEDDHSSSSFAVLYLSSGIGLGLFVNGALLEGADGSASEFGHLLWREGGALCRCGRRGCIEAYASDFGIYRSAHPELQDTPPTRIEPKPEELADLADKARAGDTIATQAFNTAGHAIGTGLSHLLMLANPQKIFFTGPGKAHFDLLRPKMEETLNHIQDKDLATKMELIDDDRDLVEVGLLALAHQCLDRDIFARRVSVEEMAARLAYRRKLESASED